jgi:histidine ammonia-lyase
MDKLKIAVTKLCMLSERQLNYLLNDSLNEKLTPFINTGKLGVNLGLQGIQFTATSTTSENQTLSFPSYIHSIPSNKDNQDIVSMGANAALITQKVIENTFEVLAIEFIAIVRAIDSINLKDKLSSQTGKFYAELKKVIDPDTSDRVLYKDILNIKELLKKIAADSQII